MAEDSWLVVGLGNPGRSYVGNRHNAGYLVLDLLADRLGERFKAHKGRALVAETHLAGRRVVLAKPTTFMNDSGGPVASLLAFHRVPLGRLVVVHDELDLPYGTLRLKRAGGDNGHNGLRSVTAALGPDYLRVRLGVGRPPGRQDPAAFLLRDFTPAERKELPLHVERAADAVEALLGADLETVQNTFHAAPA